jgi:glycosyltransferase involved in cell wall biosynthesis
MPVPAKILIISNGALCRNPRVLKEATALSRAGYDVTVLTVRGHASSEKVDVELLRTVRFHRETVDMLPGISSHRLLPFYRRLVQWSARRAMSTLRLESARALGPVGSLLRRAHRLPADLTIVHNEAAHWVGMRLLARGRRVAADIEDWHSEDLLPDARADRPLALIQSVERTLLRECVYTTTTSHALADALHVCYGGTRPEVITNSFSLQPSPPPGPRATPPAFFWFSQTVGSGRGLELFLAAWRQSTCPSRVVLLGETQPAYRDRLLSRLPVARRAALMFQPLVAPTELPGLIARHDVGLALEPLFPANKNLTISNKILQYLNAGLAVVATNTAGQREVLARDPAAGVVVDAHETTVFARSLDELVSDRDALAARQLAARRLAETVYCWEREEPRLLALVDEALRRPPPAGATVA